MQRFLAAAAVFSSAVLGACNGAIYGEVHGDVRQVSPSSLLDKHGANETRSLSSPMYLLCGVDFLGADVTSVKTADITTCPSLCDRQYPKCILSTWTDFEGGTCWLKTLELEVKSVQGKANAATFIRLEQPKKPVALAWDTHQGVDMVGFDMGSQPATDMNQCTSQCYQKVGCFGATWSNGTCYLKSRVSPVSLKVGATSAFIARMDTPLTACPRV